jgi:micrococcal nuclease
MMNRIRKILFNNSNNKNKNNKIITTNYISTNIDYSSAIRFIPPITSGFVIKVYDGDTITIVSHLPYEKSPLYKFSVRLNNIDCPEIRSNNPSEICCAKIARDELTKLILHKVVSLKNVNVEKYGRILADVYLDDLYINEYMIKQHLAVYYDGGTKQSPNDWMEYYKERSCI